MNSKNNVLKVDSILFDLDGTLWDGVGAYAQGFNDFFIASNIERRLTKADISSYMGMEETQYLEKTLPELPAAKRKDVYNEIISYQYKRISKDRGILYDGVREGLEKLAEKYRLFIVSNCAEFTIQHFMNWANIAALITDTISHGMNYKPKHENIRYLIDKHHLASPIYIGDTDSDRKQCDLLKIPFGFAAYGFGHTNSYTLRFESFKEVTDYFC